MIQGDSIIHKTPTLQVLTRSQCQQLHMATLELLRRTGVEVLSDEVRSLMEGAGCWLDGDRVRIPPDLIEWALRVAPKRVVLTHRTSDARMELEGAKSYYGTGSDTVFVVDAKTGERRRAVLKDVANVARLVDGLPNVDFLMCMGIASDVTESISDVHHFNTMLRNTGKPIVYTAWDRANLADILDMAEAVAGGPEELRRSPFCALYSEPISPLTHAEESCDKLLEVCGRGLPVVYTPGMQIGGTAPVTIAGALVQANAEQLSGLLICQLIRQGAPMIGGGGILFMDMTRGLISYAAPEFMLAMAAYSDLCHFYQLPIFSFAGCSDAKRFDQQAAAEGSLWMLVSALSGGNLIHDLGYLEGGLTASYDLIVAMDEVAGLVKRFMRGVPVDDETMALDVIEEVGPGGHFIGSEHTYRHFRENWVPGIFDRSSYSDWSGEGGPSLGDRTHQRVLDLLAAQQPPPMAAEVAERLDAIVNRAEARVG
ncbi:MAG: trimethylamine methyltransferase family protein [Anaerolineales bacterium]